MESFHLHKIVTPMDASPRCLLQSDPPLRLLIFRKSGVLRFTSYDFVSFFFCSLMYLAIFNQLSNCFLRVQELQRPEDHEEGRVPRTVECELMEDLVDTCIPGDVVTVTGIIGVINNYMDIGGGIDSITLMVLFIV